LATQIQLAGSGTCALTASADLSTVPAVSQTVFVTARFAQTVGRAVAIAPARLTREARLPVTVTRELIF